MALLFRNSLEVIKLEKKLVFISTFLIQGEKMVKYTQTHNMK